MLAECQQSNCSFRDSALQHVTQQTWLLCCVTQQTCLSGGTLDTPAARHSRHACPTTQQTWLLCDIAFMSAVCCVTRHTSLLCDTADISAVRHNTRCCYSTRVSQKERAHPPSCDTALQHNTRKLTIEPTLVLLVSRDVPPSPATQCFGVANKALVPN